ncbi:MAG: T9SS type A sorting domain-containing protein [Ignavibacteriae bacterium]|nr:T9SS type A sorting domain-containing protein [Ignavibacteriota bacterium]
MKVFSTLLNIRFILCYFILYFIIPPGIYSQAFNTPIVFVSRNHELNGNVNYPQAGLLPGMGSYSRFKVVGGKLMVRDATGNVQTLIDSTMEFGNIRIIDVQQPCVHWYGHKILFAGIENRDSNWRIYEINTEGTRLIKLTFTNRNADLSQFGNAAYKFLKYDDIDPVYLPDGKIIFASTRYPTLAEIGGVNATNLFITDTLTNLIHRVTTERNGGEKPTIDPISGRILYSRWWVNIDRPSNVSGTGLTRLDEQALTTDIGNIWQTNIVNPDGDALKQYATDGRNRKSLYSYRPRVMPDGKLVSIFIPTPLYNNSGSPGIRYYEKGFSEAVKVIGVDSTTPLFITNPPSYGTMQPPYATDPLPVSNGKILFSYATSVSEQDYGIYTCNLNGGELTQIIDLPGTLELNAELLIPRKIPPVVQYLEAYDTNLVPPTINPNTFYQGGLFRFDCLNVYSNAPVDAPIDNAPPITKNAKFRFFFNFQREDENGQDHPILFREINLDRDGKIAEGDMPANVSMFEQIVDSNEKVLVNKTGEIAHVFGMNFGNDGSGTKCVGCHAGHTMITVPPNVTEGAFTNLSTSADVRESSFRTSGNISYKGQNTVDRKARNTDLKVNWIANGGNDEYIVMKWEIPIDVRRFTLYDIMPNSATNTDIHVTDCELIMYKNNMVVNQIPSTGPLSTEGLNVTVSPVTTIDSVKIIVKSFTGLVNNESSAGLAEVETNSRVSSEDLIGINDPVAILNDYKLEQNYPNPFNPSTIIRFSLPKSQNITLEVFDISGRNVATLISGRVESGNNSIQFSPYNLSSGIYFYKLTADNFTETRKMVLVR